MAITFPITRYPMVIIAKIRRREMEAGLEEMIVPFM
jgi:hypothetical protein